jgi:O-antigen ligase
VHQGSVSAQCIEKRVDENGDEKPDVDTADGRVCGRGSDCIQEGEWDIEWACERIGLFKTISTGGRVRWRGQLNDPNELSVFLGGMIPLFFALGLPFRNAASNRGPSRQKLLAILTVIAVALALYAVILSESRGGQLVIATVFTILFVSRFGKKGLLFAAVAALPVLLLGGRDDAEADESSAERLELLYDGVSLVIAHPFRGVGVDQFPDQVASPLHLSAHNSYLLAVAETGLPGFFAWSGIVWTSLKIPLTALKRASLSPEIRAMAMALVVSYSGIFVGIFFLSFTYKQLLFVWFGLAGAFYGIMKEAEPTIDVRLDWRDYVGLLLADVGVIGLLYIYTRAKGGGS